MGRLLICIQRQRDLEAKAGKKEEASARERWQHRLYPNHDESNVRADADGSNEAGPSARRTRYLPPLAATSDEESEDDVTFPGPNYLPEYAGGNPEGQFDIWHPSEALDEWDDLGNGFGAGYDGYQDYLPDIDLDLAYDAVRQGTEDGSIFDSNLMRRPAGRSDSPPWSLSRERQRARNARINPSRPGSAAAIPTHDPLPLFLPVGDTPLPASDDDPNEIYEMPPARGISLTDPVPRSRERNRDLADPGVLTPIPPFSAEMDRPDWLQLARTEIDEETGSNRSGEAVSPEVIIPDIALNALTTSNPATSVPQPARTGLRGDAAPFQPNHPLAVSTRRRRIHLEETGVPDESERNVRRRTAGGMPYLPYDQLNRPPLLARSRPSLPVPERLGGARMQRTRHSMPPTATAPARDTRRDGLVLEYADARQQILQQLDIEARQPNSL